MAKARVIRVLIAKPGLDGHDRGARVLTLGLRELGMDVIYTGLRQTPEQIVERAFKEKVDVIGLSSLSGAHNTLFPEVALLAKEKGMDKVLIIGGGLIPKEDIPLLQEKGIRAIFSPGVTIKKIAEFIESNVSL
jgi:methylmalonyl-CoA mutase C-terminal domain/subunit